MGVASVSKTVTAVALLKLWEEFQKTDRKFSLDEPFWPRIKAVCPNAHADVQRVTIRQLLMHRSGLAKTADYFTPRDVEKLLMTPLAHKPGEVYEYQNNNFYLLHVVIEQIGQVQYTPYVKAHVLEPMGIEHMQTHSEAQQPMCCYAKHGSTEPGDAMQNDCAAWAGPSGWYASVSDMGRFLTGLRDHKVLTPETTTEMLKDNLGWDGSEPGWSKGGLWPSGDRRFGSVIAHFPDSVDAVLLVNCDPSVDIQGLLNRAWRECRE
jgi:CubicO group peptidase (beta-lactamase class C family)